LGNGVGLGTLDSETVNNQDVETREEFTPASLSTTWALGQHEVFEILVIRLHLNWFLSAKKLRFPVFEGANYCQQLLVINPLVAFGWRSLLRHESNRIQSSLVINLRENCRRHEI
jgi:hypothetical protein